MYWCQWVMSEAKLGLIEVAYMDGSSRKIFVQGNMLWPNGLTLDTLKSQLYWSDTHLNRIERINLDGTGREV